MRLTKKPCVLPLHDSIRETENNGFHYSECLLYVQRKIEDELHGLSPEQLNQIISQQ